MSDDTYPIHPTPDKERKSPMSTLTPERMAGKLRYAKTVISAYREALSLVGKDYLFDLSMAERNIGEVLNALEETLPVKTETEEDKE